jgi:predicted nucleic acid-binding protein
LKLYLDVSCLNRPFDDQSQSRIRLEAEAMTIILEKCETGTWQHVSSEMSKIEIDAIPDTDRRARIQLLLPDPKSMLELTETIYERAATLETLGFKAADAVHVAAAETLAVNVFLSCDDRLCRLAKRRRAHLTVQVTNPLDWLKEISHDIDS